MKRNAERASTAIGRYLMIAALLLPLTGIALTACGQDAAPLTDWQVMTDEIDRGHTIAGDGLVYLADDTENNRIPGHAVWKFRITEDGIQNVEAVY